MKVVSSQWLVVSSSSFCSALCALIIALHSFAEAQQAKRIPRIGFMTAGGAETDVRFESFREGLRDFGYVDGKSILIEFRSADAKVDRIPTILAELVRGKPDVM